MMQETAARQAARNLVFSATLAEILAAANARGIACLPLRGVALSEQLYGNPLVRPTGDVDLLIQKDDLPRIRTLLQELGCYEAEARPGFAGEFEYTLEFFKDAPMPLVIEPHWTIAYPPHHRWLDMSPVWARTTEGVIAGVPTRLLACEDLLIHLCLHLLHHYETAPQLWRSEIDRLIRLYPPQWPLVRTIAQQARVDGLVAQVLEEVRGMFETPISAEVMETLRRGDVPRADRRLVDFLGGAPHVRGRERIAMLLALPGLGAKVRYAASFLFPSVAFIRAQYGVSSWWRIGWIYCRRAAGLMWDAIRGLVKLAAVSTYGRSHGHR